MSAESGYVWGDLGQGLAVLKVWDFTSSVTTSVSVVAAHCGALHILRVCSLSSPRV